MQHASSRLSPRTSRRHVTLVLLVVALALSGLPAPPVSADTRVVLNANDSGDDSLRKAIADSALGDTIVFDASLSDGTILLTEPLVVPRDHILTIDGSALLLPLTLDGQGTQRVFEVSEGATVTLRGLTIHAGFHAVEGGGILSRGTLTVDACDLEGNRVEAPAGSTAVGGAISNHGDLTVTDSTFQGNSAGNLLPPPATINPGHGGAIYSAEGAALTVERSTFTDNGAIGLGGGIHSMGAPVGVGQHVRRLFVDGGGRGRDLGRCLGPSHGAGESLCGEPGVVV